MSASWEQYQLMTTIAKKVGGPVALAGLVFAAGAAANEGFRRVSHIVAEKKKPKTNEVLAEAVEVEAIEQ